MFTYFESYHPRVWEGFVRRGFVRSFTGLRFCQNILLPDALKFNRLAALGGAFDRLQRELNCPMYIDRLQGGCNIDTYPYDPQLLTDYRARLGDKFWGFQMHEWMSNYRSDIAKLDRGGCVSWTAEEIEAVIRRDFPVKYLFLEAMTQHEMAAIGRPSSASEFYRHARWLYETRTRAVADLIPCDSAYMAFKLELEAMARLNPGRPRRFMPEVGAQTSDSRLQISYARSMAKAYGAEFGVYYEPWGGDPFSACCYNRNPMDNEWAIGAPGDFPFQTQGEGGGSSRSLQRRIHLYGYFSGASFMSEEWGMCNTFRDWQDFEVSPYGRVKQEFLDFVERYPDVGEKLSPVAVVLPRELDVLQNIHSEDIFGYHPADGTLREELERRAALRRIFSAAVPMIGTETASLINSEIPDAVDLIHADASTLETYRFLVDLSGGQIPAHLSDRVIPVDRVADVCRGALPCTVDGGLHWMVNRRANGRHFLILFNHSGINRSVTTGEYAIPEATETVTVQLRGGSLLRALEGSTAVTRDGNRYRITVPAGDWFLGEF